jgi:hypothetical protein
MGYTVQLVLALSLRTVERACLLLEQNDERAMQQTRSLSQEPAARLSQWSSRQPA